MSTRIAWGAMPTTEEFGDWVVLGMPEPDRLLPTLNKERSPVDNHYLHCPAVQDLYKNTFIVRSPVDLVIKIDKDKNIFTDRFGQGFYDALIVNRSSACGKDDPMLMSCAFSLLFVPNKPCDLELIPAHMHTTEFSQNTRVICGRFDAYKWTRNLDFTFEVIDSTKPVVLKRGDPLYYVRFLPKDESKVTLEHVVITEEMETLVKAVQQLKLKVPRLPLPTMYKLAERLDKSIFFKKKCPFKFLKGKVK